MFEGFPFKCNVKTSRPLSVSVVFQYSHSDSHSQARLKTPPKSSEFSPIYFTRSHVGQAQDTEFNVGRQLVSWGAELASPWALGGGGRCVLGALGGGGRVILEERVGVVADVAGGA